MNPSMTNLSKPKGAPIDGRPCQCVNGGGVPKKRYRNEAGADDAAKRINDQYPEQDPQRPYRCEEGGVWHLTSKPAGLNIAANTHGRDWQPTLAHNTRLDHAMKVAESAEGPARLREKYTDEQKMKAFKLRDQGLSHREIARQIGMDEEKTPNLSVWFRNPELEQRYLRTKAQPTIADYESEEQKLERQLAEVRTKKAAAIEAKQWKFTPSFGGSKLILKKENESMTVPLEAAEELVIALSDFLKELSR